MCACISTFLFLFVCIRCHVSEIVTFLCHFLVSLNVNNADDIVIWEGVMFSDVHLPASLVQEEKTVALLTLEIRRQSLLWMIFDKH